MEISNTPPSSYVSSNKNVWRRIENEIIENYCNIEKTAKKVCETT